jgi:hypothetical protein
MNNDKFKDAIKLELKKRIDEGTYEDLVTEGFMDDVTRAYAKMHKKFSASLDDLDQTERARLDKRAGRDLEDLEPEVEPEELKNASPEEASQAVEDLKNKIKQTLALGGEWGDAEFKQFIADLYASASKVDKAIDDKIPGGTPGGTPDGAPDGDPNADGGEGGDADKIPIYKYPQTKDPETGKRLQPLSSKLKKADLPQHVVNTIMRSIAKQLTKGNDLQITEKMKKDIIQLVVEGLADTGKKGTTKEGDLLDQLDSMLDGFQSREEVEQFADTVRQGKHPDGTPINRKGSIKIKNHYTEYVGKGKIEDKLSSFKPKGPPEPWVTQGGTQEEWDALPPKEQFVFLKMPSNKQSKFFKMGSDERMDIYKQLKTSTSKSKSELGAEETSDAQDAAAQAAIERGIDPEKGTIKMSTLNQQLQTIDPPADDKTRKIALKIVQQHLAPYMKKHGLKFSEQKLVSMVEKIILTETKKLRSVI